VTSPLNNPLHCCPPLRPCLCVHVVGGAGAVPAGPALPRQENHRQGDEPVPFYPCTSIPVAPLLTPHPHTSPRHHHQPWADAVDLRGGAGGRRRLPALPPLAGRAPRGVRRPAGPRRTGTVYGVRCTVGPLPLVALSHAPASTSRTSTSSAATDRPCSQGSAAVGSAATRLPPPRQWRSTRPATRPPLRPRPRPRPRQGLLGRRAARWCWCPRPRPVSPPRPTHSRGCSTTPPPRPSSASPCSSPR